MMWIGIILIWLVAPFAELGVIIALLIKNDTYKARIRELEKRIPGQISAAAAYRSMEEQTEDRATEETVQMDEEWLASSCQGPVEEQAVQMDDEWPTSNYQEQATEEAMQMDEKGPASSCQRQAEEQAIQMDDEWPTSSCQGPVVEQTMQMDEEGPASSCQRQERKWQEAKTSQPVPMETEQILPLRGHHNLGMFALILGVVFIVLSGLIFATTTWHILPDVCKVFLVFGCAVLFFGVSLFAERRFHVYKTSNAFYILGSIFLFLTILAAAYFKLLGSEFILEGRNRWKVLWVGSVVTASAFWAGLKRFDDKVYTQACLWEISISLFFMAKAFSFGWDGFAAVMMVYSTMLVCVREYLVRQDSEKEGLKGILSDGFGFFAPIHFGFFAVVTVLRGLPAIWIMIGSCAIGYDGSFLGEIWFFSFTAFGVMAMAAMMIGTYILARRRQTETYGYLFSLAALETILYTAGWITEVSVYRMAVINLALLLIQIVRYYKRERGAESRGLFWDICGGGFLAFSIIAMTAADNDTWRFAYLLTAAFDCLQYRNVESIRKKALSLSACFVAAAFWLQPFGLWPQIIRLEMSLLPFVWLLWTMGRIWEHVSGISVLKNIGYLVCLVLLFWDAIFSGLVVDSLLLEGICLGAFVWAQIKNHAWWGRITGGMSLMMALFMTRGFWLSISWWVYLLGAGIALIILAGIIEKREKEKEEETS